MINPQWLELPMSRMNFHGPKDVRAIVVRLYIQTKNTSNRGTTLELSVEKLHVHDEPWDGGFNQFNLRKNSPLTLVLLN